VGTAESDIQGRETIVWKAVLRFRELRRSSAAAIAALGVRWSTHCSTAGGDGVRGRTVIAYATRTSASSHWCSTSPTMTWSPRRHRQLRMCRWSSTTQESGSARACWTRCWWTFAGSWRPICRNVCVARAFSPIRARHQSSLIVKVLSVLSWLAFGKGAMRSAERGHGLRSTRCVLCGATTAESSQSSIWASWTPT
jgi:hypothetical protein